MGFQTEFNIQQAPAVTGDFSTTNPQIFYPTVEAGFVAGSDGVTVGCFVWVDTDGRSLNNFGVGEPIGFVAREMQALITDYLQEASMVIPAGFMVTVYRKGDFYVQNNYNDSVAGEKCFVNIFNGTMRSAPAGTIISGYVETDYVILENAVQGTLTKIYYVQDLNYTPSTSDKIITESGLFLTTESGLTLITE